MGQPTLRRGLIDTDILVDASRGTGVAGEFLESMLGEHSITISAVTAMELMAGSRNAAQLSEVKCFLGETAIVPLNESVSERATTLVEAYTLSHSLRLPDALIAATALECGLALYTRNIRHYRMIPELLIIQPY